MNIPSICRVCLVKDSSSNMRLLSDQQSRELLFECTSVSVEPGDKLPQQMCANCWGRCNSWCEFKTMAQDSDRRLRFRKEEEQQTDNHKIEAVLGEMLNDDDEEITTVKEEPVEYLLEGYSLAPEECSDPGEDDRQTEQKKTPKKKQPRRTKNNPFKCGNCPKTFLVASLLERHEVVHMTERPFFCDICDLRFTCERYLATHKKTHSNIRPYECKECEKSFKSKGDLSAHHLIHAGIKAFKCDQCGKKFTLKSTLAAHKTVHSEKRAFKCGVCKSKFKHNYSLLKHLRRKNH